MFTGIVEGQGSILKREGGRFSVSIPWQTQLMTIGQSVAVDGCCLTVVEAGAKDFAFDLSPETLARTTLGARKISETVNIERGLRMEQPLDGHIVSGHVDGVGTIRSITPIDDDCQKWWLNVPTHCLKWLVEKGSVAVDGISLTVNEIDEEGLSFVLIPHTLKVTGLGKKKVGDGVNLEFDLLAKYVERLLERRFASTAPKEAKA